MSTSRPVALGGPSSSRHSCRSAPAAPAGPTRRQLAAGGVAVTLLGLTGCTEERPDEPAALPRLRRNPDHELVVASLAVEQRHLDRVRAVRRRHRSVRAALAASLAVHQAHVELLRGAVEDASGPEAASWSVPGKPERALDALAASARAAYREQVDIAMAAESGTFARLATGMAAAAAQQERFLTDLRPRSRGAAR
ncbi:MAG TPA: hypothetical protein VFG72_17285 [Marmoricola sp.]|nr:hypothetical protein [Marmoricola sp.]